MFISLIAILTTNHVIGRENSIPWYFSIDRCWFKYHTFGKPIIMGRKTFESIAKKPLLGRLNIVLSNKLLFDQQFNNVCVVNTPEQALSLVQGSHEVIIIGGSLIYNIFLPKCKRMYLTYIDYIYHYGDTWFPKYNHYKWQVIFNVHTVYNINKRISYNLYFTVLERY